MLKTAQKFSAITQNVILGSVTGIMVGFNLRIIFLRVGGVDMVWMAFFLLGPAVGYLSGRERQRIEKLKKEKSELEANVESVQLALQQSNKKYRLLVEQANDAIFLTSVDGRFLLFNEATCLYSGFSRRQMKGMNIKDLHGKNSSQVEEAWLDNGVYRYEDHWVSKQGRDVLLEINARWVQFGDHRLILHVGRDVKRQKEVGKKDLIKHTLKIQENRLIAMAQLHERLYKDNLDPVFETMAVLRRLQEKYPEEKKVLEDLITTWDSAQGTLTEFYLKNDRDLGTSPQPWDINAMLHQELVYLDTVSDSRNFKVKTSFASDLRPVYGFGRDYSVAFGTVFQALRGTMENLKQKGLFISTRLLDDQILIEIMAPGRDALAEQLLYVLDPFYEEYTDTSNHKKLGMELVEAIFQVIDARFDSAYQQGKGNIIRVRVPTVKHNQISENGRSRTQPANQDVII